MRGLKFSTLLGEDKGQDLLLLKFVCLFQVKFNFSIENIFFFRVVP